MTPKCGDFINARFTVQFHVIILHFIRWTRKIHLPKNFAV